MILLVESIEENNRNDTRTYYECDDLQITAPNNDHGYIFSLNRESKKKENISVCINGDKSRNIFLMNENGKTIDRFYYKLKTKNKHRHLFDNDSDVVK